MSDVRDLMSLDGRVALVTGGDGHLGRVVCTTLRGLGAHVVALDRAASEGVVACDLADQGAVEAVTRQVTADHGRLDVVVHCAAFVGTTKLPGWAEPAESQSAEVWGQALAVNVSSLFTIVQTARPFLAASGKGSVVAVSSIYGKHGPDMRLYEGTSMGNPAGYGVTKGGLEQLVRHMAVTMAPDVRVNTISPGGIFRGQPSTFVERYEQRTPMRRMATEADMAGAVAYLCTDLSLYVTGIDIPVDGGWGAW
ncbi:MAG: SDR family oxidoreductase [Fimbriimonadaceae bacterium]|nr:SDR family oxidoreductase [Fimbriimonadaceae bacterium]